jgi:1,5-anhydro-D-fructose reductase (1,5-anhydro-D-mannitol-forming)
VAYYRRALPRFLKIKSMVEEGLRGEIRGVNVRLYHKPTQEDRKGVKHWRVDAVIAGGGYFVDLGSHMIDLLQYFLGPISTATGYAANQCRLYDVEDIVGAIFTFDNGVQGVGLWSFGAEENLDQTEIIGSLGSITYSNFMDLPVVLRRGGRAEEFHIAHPEPIQQSLIQTVVDELLSTGRCPSTGRSGAMTSRVMDMVLGKL